MESRLNPLDDLTQTAVDILKYLKIVNREEFLESMKSVRTNYGWLADMWVVGWLFKRNKRSDLDALINDLQTNDPADELQKSHLEIIGNLERNNGQSFIDIVKNMLEEQNAGAYEYSRNTYLLREIIHRLPNYDTTVYVELAKINEIKGCILTVLKLQQEHNLTKQSLQKEFELTVDELKKQAEETSLLRKEMLRTYSHITEEEIEQLIPEANKVGQTAAIMRLERINAERANQEKCALAEERRIQAQKEARQMEMLTACKQNTTSTLFKDRMNALMGDRVPQDKKNNQATEKKETKATPSEEFIKARQALSLKLEFIKQEVATVDRNNTTGPVGGINGPGFR